MHTYQKLHFMNRIVELRAVSKLSYFFLYTLYIEHMSYLTFKEACIIFQALERCTILSPRPG